MSPKEVPRRAFCPDVQTSRSSTRPDHQASCRNARATLGAFVLLTAGIMLCTKRLAGRTFAYLGAAISIFSISLAVVIRLAGGHALLYGVGYPIVIVLLLRRATPSDGLRSLTENSTSPDSTQDSGGHLRSALA